MWWKVMSLDGGSGVERCMHVLCAGEMTLFPFLEDERVTTMNKLFEKLMGDGSGPISLIVVI